MNTRPVTAQVEEIEILLVLLISFCLLPSFRLLCVGYSRVCLPEQGVYFCHGPVGLLRTACPGFALVPSVLRE